MSSPGKPRQKEQRQRRPSQSTSRRGLPQEEAAAATATPFDSLANEKDLALPIATWPSERIWERIQGIGEAAKPEAEPRSRRLTGRPRWRGEAKGARQGRGGPAQQRPRPNPIAPRGRSKPPRHAAGARRPRWLPHRVQARSTVALSISPLSAASATSFHKADCRTLIVMRKKVTACCPSRSEGPFRQSSEEQSNSANSAADSAYWDPRLAESLPFGVTSPVDCLAMNSMFASDTPCSRRRPLAWRVHSPKPRTD